MPGLMPVLQWPESWAAVHVGPRHLVVKCDEVTWHSFISRRMSWPGSCASGLGTYSLLLLPCVEAVGCVLERPCSRPFPFTLFLLGGCVHFLTLVLVCAGMQTAACRGPLHVLTGEGVLDPQHDMSYSLPCNRRSNPCQRAPACSSAVVMQRCVVALRERVGGLCVCVYGVLCVCLACCICCRL